MVRYSYAVQPTFGDLHGTRIYILDHISPWPEASKMVARCFSSTIDTRAEGVFNSGRRYNKFEPFVLASHAEQVNFIPYPRLKDMGITWLAAIKIIPHGRVVSGEEPHLQEEVCITEIELPDLQTDEILLIDPDNR